MLLYSLEKLEGKIHIWILIMSHLSVNEGGLGKQM